MKKIDIMWNSAIEDIHGAKDTGVTGVKIKDTISGDLRNVSIAMVSLWQLVMCQILIFLKVR